MKKTITYCDMCGLETDIHDPVKFGPAKATTKDVCGKCSVELLNVFLPVESGARVIDYINASRESKKIV